MTWSFTAAAERALSAAAGWNSHNDRDELGAPELLLGLLAEQECRAATMLLAQGVDARAVQSRWPVLHRHANGSTREFSPAVEAALQAAIDRLWAYPRPLSLATEHLLLGLAAAPGETAAWLAEQGFDAASLEQQIHHLYGHDPRPLPLEPLGDSEVGGMVRQAAPRSADAATAKVTTAESSSVAPGGLSGARSDVSPAQQCPRPSAPLANAETIGMLGESVAVALARVIDAAGNRAGEGLRVVEDYVRFVLDDRHLTGELKQLRHDLQAALSTISRQELLSSRDTCADVGATLTTPTEFSRPDMASVVAANFRRLEESLRSLEEYTKVCDPAAAATIERLRYRTYTLERATGLLQASLDRLAAVRLCVLIDGQQDEASFERLVDALIAGGVHMIQLRDKKLADRDLLARARRLCARTHIAGVISIINDRADIAAAAQADGVHVGQDDLPVKDARTLIGARGLVGVSTHSIEQARQAVIDGASYIGVGPTFFSATKQFSAFTGVELLREVAEEIRLPAFAIGGVNETNLAEVIAAGFSRVAVSGAVSGTSDPGAAVRRLLSALQRRG